MSSSLLSLKLVFFFSFSFATSRPILTPAPKATPADLLSLLGTPHQISTVNPTVASELRSCFRFLVPFSPFSLSPLRRALRAGESKRREREENELVWRPPPPMAELARLAVESGGDPDAIYRALDPSIIPVPDVEESKEHRCELTRTPYGRRFINEDLNVYLKFLFELIVARGPSIGLNVSLSRFDFFHGHIFLASNSGRLGILFHAKEYPACDNEKFPYNMGYCQIGSNVVYNEEMNLRNILWLAPMPSNSTDVAPGVLVVLDARPDGIIYRDIIPEYVNYARTIYEGLELFAASFLISGGFSVEIILKQFYMHFAEDFGDVVADVNYMNIGGLKPDYQIFIC